MSTETRGIDAQVAAIVAEHRNDPTRLVQILRDIVAIHGWVPRDAIGAIAHALQLSRARVEGVAGFYSFLGTEPRGRFHVLFSDNVTDVMSGDRKSVV